MSHIVVIGGGIVGLTVAEKLIDNGHNVTLIEKDAIAAGASAGNAAALAFDEVFPMASPALIKSALKWLVDPLGPFTIVPQDMPLLLSWLIRFAMACRASQYQSALEAKVALNQHSKKCWMNLFERTGLEDHCFKQGAIHLYEDRRNFEQAKKDWNAVAQYGIEVQAYEGQALHQFQPGLSKSFVAGIFSPGWYSVSNPRLLCHEIHSTLQERGLKTVFGDVQTIFSNTSHAISLDLGDRTLSCEQLVIAAGPWSNRLVIQCGDHVPLIGERGYNTTLPKSAMKLDRTLVLSEQGFVISPLVDGIRVGGASEIARLDRPANYARSEMMLQKATERIPALNSNDGQVWFGARPTTSDALPVIGRSSWSDRILYAFGHSHLGLTQAAGTAHLIGQLINGEEPAIDLSPFRANRF